MRSYFYGDCIVKAGLHTSVPINYLYKGSTVYKIFTDYFKLYNFFNISGFQNRFEKNR